MPKSQKPNTQAAQSGSAKPRRRGANQFKTLPQSDFMSQNARVCHLYEIQEGNVLCRVSGGDFDGLEMTGRPDNFKFTGSLGELRDLGYRFCMKDDYSHVPPLNSPSAYMRNQLAPLRLPMALPD